MFYFTFIYSLKIFYIFILNTIDISANKGYILITVTITIIVCERRSTMATLKYSRQRESIKKYLATTTDHPTADMVYLHVKNEFPNISLGTVYRNLNLLTDLGEIVKIPAPDGGDRFDGDVRPHNHFFCTSCHKVLDMHLEKGKLEEMMKDATKDFDQGVIESSRTVFYGKCNDCISKH